MSGILKDVVFSYDDKTVLAGVTLALPDSGVICLAGPSGSGKTTLLRLLCGLIVPQSGTIENAPQRPAMLFQENRLLPWETAAQNLRLVTDDENVARWLEIAGLSEEADSYPREMSGGMQRRLALVRALALDSDLLLLDEPFTGIDRDRIAALVQPIREYAQTRPVVLVTHTEEDAALLGAEIYDLRGVPVTACVPRRT